MVDEEDAGDPEMREQDELQPDLDVLHQYAEDHPDLWGGVEFRSSVRPARLVVFVKGEPAEEAGRIRALVPHPDRIDVLAVTMAERDRHALAGQLIDRLQTVLPPGTAFGVGHGPGARVVVALPTGFDQLARELVAEYGDVVTVEVGVSYRPLSAR